MKKLRSVRWGPKGRWLLTAGRTPVKPRDDGKPIEDGSIDAWDLSEGTHRHVFHLGDEFFGRWFYAGFTPNGRGVVASGSAHSTPWPVAYWDLEAGTTQFTGAHINYPEGIEVSHDGKRAVVDGGGGNAVLLALPSLKVLAANMNDTSVSGWMKFSHDDDVLVSNYDRFVALQSARDLKDIKTFNGSSALSPDRKTLALASPTTWGLVDVATGRVLRRFDKAPKDPEGVGAVLAFAPDGRHVAAFSYADGAVHVWRTVDGKRAGRVADASAGMLWTSDARILIVGRQPFEVATKKKLPKLPKGEYRAGVGSHVLVWGERTGRVVNVDTGEPTGVSWTPANLDDDDEPHEPMLSADKAFLAFGTGAGTLAMIRLSDGRRLDLGVARRGAEAHPFVIAEDGAFEGPKEARSCAAVVASPKVARGVLSAFMAR